MVCLSARGIIWKGKTNQLGTQQPLRYTYIKFTHIYIYIYIYIYIIYTYVYVYIYVIYWYMCEFSTGKWNALGINFTIN